MCPHFCKRPQEAISLNLVSLTPHFPFPLQNKFVETTQKSKHLTQTIMQREQDIRRAALTGTELTPLPDDIGCYKGLGRSFVKQPKDAIVKNLQDLVTDSTAEIEKAKGQREYLQKTLTETEANIKELLQGNEALSRELLQRGYMGQ